MSSPDPTSNDLHVNNKDYIDGNKEAEYLALINRGAVLLSRYPLVPQSANHDCGIACLRMVLRGLDVPQAETLLAEAMEASDLGESVWTPDLLRILLHCGLRAQLYSICLLPNPGYAQLSCMHCNCLSLSSPCCGDGPYQGHYILLCGYLSEERRLIYRIR
uniref:ULP_PROTEASE domain-containing protein n=1 Tax=Macrostomum lignano TaxID=282301 RepID=A0A1I8ISC5_9PLAT